MASRSLDRGTLVADRYTVEHELGRGAMGAVHLAWDRLVETWVALKVGRPLERMSQEQFRARFLREAKIGQRLGQHEGLVRARDWGQLDPERCWLVMDLVRGARPLCLVAGTRRERVALLLRCARLVSEVHRLGVVHRDLKPENFLRDEAGQVLLGDFGLAKVVDEDAAGDDPALAVQLTLAGTSLGTPHYMAPEQHRDAGLADPRADVYSLGVMLFEALTGRLPFGGAKPREIFQGHLRVLRGQLPPPRPHDLDPTVDPELDEVCSQALRVVHTDRLASADDLARELETALERGITEPRESLRVALGVPPRRGDTALETGGGTGASSAGRSTYSGAPSGSALVLAIVLASAAGGVTLAWGVGFARARSFEAKTADPEAGVREPPARDPGPTQRADEILAGYGYARSLSERLEVCQAALDEDPNHDLARLLRAETYRLSGQVPTTDDGLASVAAGDSPALAALARALLAERDGADPLQELELALREDALLVPAYVGRARCYLQRGEYVPALSDASEAVRLDPLCAEAYLLRAEARWGLGERDALQGDLDDALRLLPDHSRSLALRALAQLDVRPYGENVSPEASQQARLDAEAALAAAEGGGEPWAHVALAHLTLRGGDPRQARRHATAACQAAPDDPLCQETLARVLQTLDDHDSTLDASERALQALPQDSPRRPRLHVLRAASLIQQRDFVVARAEVERALNADHDLPHAYFLRGQIHLKDRARQQLSRAVDDLSRAITLKPDFADAYYYRGIARHDQGRYEDALRDLDRAQALRIEGRTGISLADLEFIRGICHMQEGAWGPALRALTAFLEQAGIGHRAYRSAQQRADECRDRLRAAGLDPADYETSDGR
jgi:tetratricopeptide (TPR) repeat protein/tRNA A-37 threonylcarbamoyl transferase component Bud32